MINLFKNKHHKPEFYSLSQRALPIEDAFIFQTYLCLHRNECSIQWNALNFFFLPVWNTSWNGQLSLGGFYSQGIICTFILGMWSAMWNITVCGIRSSGTPQSHSCRNILEDPFRLTLNTYLILFFHEVQPSCYKELIIKIELSAVLYLPSVRNCITAGVFTKSLIQD